MSEFIDLIGLGMSQPLTYVFLIYGLSFIIMFFLLYRELRNAETDLYKDAFWMLAAFALCKGFSVWADAADLMVGEITDLYGLTADNLSKVFSVLSNIFILQISIGLMTFKSPHSNIYRLFPVILFSGYVTLFLMGVIERIDADMIGRSNFGYNGGVLMSVALINLYQVQKHTKKILLLRGIMGLAIGFALYSIFDGMIREPVMGVSIYMFRMFCAIVITAASYYVKDIFRIKKSMKVDYV